MKKIYGIGYLLCTLFPLSSPAQNGPQSIIEAIYKEGSADKSLETRAYRFLDVIGPRLIGTPEMQQAHDFVKNEYESFGIEAYNEPWGEWKSWKRGISHIDMLYPRRINLEGTQMAWSPATGKKPLVAEVMVLPDLADSISYAKWLPTVKGKLIMISQPQISGRPEDSWQANVSAARLDSFKKAKQLVTTQWQNRIAKTGFTARTLPAQLEAAGAAGIIANTWSGGWGVTRVFAAKTQKIPSVELGLEDYNLLYRYLEHGVVPKLQIYAESTFGPYVPTYNTMAKIKGTVHPEEYVMLSAHLDSWDAGTGATDNGTGVLTMMEAMRILKKVYPNPKRTILVGHWGGEEQGLNGSRSFVHDHKDIADHISLVLNQDNGTARIAEINTQGFVNAYAYFDKWLNYIPESIKSDLSMRYPGAPDNGGSDNVSFVTAGIPAFYLSAKNWHYRDYTWHTQRDTYDKIVFEDIRNNAMLIAMFVYMACEEPELMSREKIQMPLDMKTGMPKKWPTPGNGTRKGP
ncbi:peptidase M28 [Taibaiella sp. KBW10]|uniref:M20/M25/M40 family metallo-hydrolase n=1 Tax=Taibaiella sp. KBW10 TaxID=2153357 RepID=UPI000F5A33BC|nr:M20/M25/M40 family metallo-hydrolase [Taibaiella sp. KBW10]RQO31321.1 peptidase M28 [Taibaiella sp. KBW10]